MINQFNNKFNLPEYTPFKRCELENAIMKKYGSIQYFYHKEWTDRSHRFGDTYYPESYTCGTKYCWEANELESDNDVVCKTPEEALMSLVIKNNLYKIVEDVYELKGNVK